MTEGEIVPVEVSPILSPAVTAENARVQMELFENLKAQILNPKIDVCMIKGRPYVKRSGWRKFALVFNISDEILSAEKEIEDGETTWRIQVRAWAPNRRSVIGIGACSTRERTFAHPEHDIYTIAHTRAKNRAISDLIGPGEVSAEELQGNPREPNSHRSSDGEDSRTLRGTGEIYPEIDSQMTKAGLSRDRLSIYQYGKKFHIQPLEELGSEWNVYDKGLVPLGARWIDDAERWEIQQ